MEINERYARHYSLNGFGRAGQQALQLASVLVIGAGGLGCPVLQYLVAAGVGKIGIVDHDRIAISNLQRQVLFDSTQVGLYKVEAAATKLRLLNPLVNIQEYIVNLSTDNAIELIEGYDIIVDCSDNFSTRYMLSDVCSLMEKPLVFGAIFEYEGQVSVFNINDEHGRQSTYRNLFPTPPGPLDTPDCNENGVLGVLPGLIGVLQATEVIKIITGVGTPLINKLMMINVRDNQTHVLEIPHITDVIKSQPTSLTEFEDFDYAIHCGIIENRIETIDKESFNQLQHSQNILIIDVRNPHELPKLNVPHLQIPLNHLPEHIEQINKKDIIIVCQEGKRSQTAASWLVDRFGTDYKIRSLEGGIVKL